MKRESGICPIILLKLKSLKPQNILLDGLIKKSNGETIPCMRAIQKRVTFLNHKYSK